MKHAIAGARRATRLGRFARHILPMVIALAFMLSSHAELHVDALAAAPGDCAPHAGHAHDADGKGLETGAHYAAPCHTDSFATARAAEAPWHSTRLALVLRVAPDAAPHQTLPAPDTPPPRRAFP